MMTTNKKTIGIYIHIPFCMSKCPYCDFYSIPRPKAEMTENFVPALQTEIRNRDKQKELQGIQAESIYFGGGTPCLLQPEQFAAIMSTLQERFYIRQDAEISMEANPAAVTAEKLRAFRNAGLNRLSIGAQSFDDEVLKILGRVHKSEHIDETVRAARRAGFDNISLDLMFGIYGQSHRSWRESVNKAIAINPEHISLYSLEIMDNTRFARDFDMGIYHQTDEAEDRIMYADALEMLDKAGYRQYEISNTAKEGYECRHNLRYWNMGEYVGFGPSAHSFEEGVRYANIADINAYIRDPGAAVCSRTVNSRQDNLSEYVFTGLRMNRGISKEAFRDKFGEDFWEAFRKERKEFDVFVSGGFAFENEDFIGLTRRGMDISNKIMMIFV